MAEQSAPPPAHTGNFLRANDWLRHPAGPAGAPEPPKEPPAWEATRLPWSVSVGRQRPIRAAPVGPGELQPVRRLEWSRRMGRPVRLQPAWSTETTHCRLSNKFWDEADSSCISVCTCSGCASHWRLVFRKGFSTLLLVYRLVCHGLWRLPLPRDLQFSWHELFDAVADRSRPPGRLPFRWILLSSAQQPPSPARGIRPRDQPASSSRLLSQLTRLPS